MSSLIKNIELQTAVLKLFKGIVYDDSNELKEYNESFITNFLSNGIILDDTAIKIVSQNDNQKLLEIINNLYGKPNYLNNTFYKSYSDVSEASDLKLFLDKILHYLTTYGFENLGIYDESTVYIPNKEIGLEISSEPIYFTKIKTYSINEVKLKVINMLNSGIALKHETINLLINIIKDLNIIADINIDDVKNKEAKCIISYELGLIPDNGDDILRTLVHIALENASLIRSVRVFRDIQLTLYTNPSRFIDCYNYIKKLNKESTIKTISETFLRNKQLWLAFKFHDDTFNSDQVDVGIVKFINKFINKLRKQAIHNHKSIKIAYNLSNVKYEIIASAIDNNYKKLTKNETIYSKIKAYNYIISLLNVDNEDFNYKNYRIRNGKTYSIEKQNKKVINVDLYKSLSIKLYDDISNTIKQKIGNNKIYIPKNIVYVAPVSEKKFVDGIPELSYIKIENSLNIGVHWENVVSNEQEINTDLDLKLVGIDSMFGWDAEYREKNDILFTGDLTVAPIKRGGATEAFLISNNKSAKLLMLNNYTNRCDVDYKLMIEDVNMSEEIKTKFIDCKSGVYKEQDDKERFKANTIFDLNKTLTLNSKIGYCAFSQKNIGVYKDNKFYFTGSQIGQGATTIRKDYIDTYLKAIQNEAENHLSINELLKDYLVEDKKDAQIDLSLDNITSDTFINLFSI